MRHDVWLIGTFFLRLFVPLLGFFSITWAPYVFWDVYRRSHDARTAAKATAKMLVAAWTIEPTMIVFAICLGFILLPIGLIPVLGWIFLAVVFKAYARLFNRVNAYFHLPGKMTLRITRAHVHGHHQDLSNPIIDTLHQADDLNQAGEAIADVFHDLDYTPDSDTASAPNTTDLSGRSARAARDGSARQAGHGIKCPAGWASWPLRSISAF